MDFDVKYFRLSDLHAGLNQGQVEELDDRGILYYTVENLPKMFDSALSRQDTARVKSLEEISETYDVKRHGGNEIELLADYLEEKGIIDVQRNGMVDIRRIDKKGFKDLKKKAEADRARYHATEAKVDEDDVHVYLEGLEDRYTETLTETLLPVTKTVMDTGPKVSDVKTYLNASDIENVSEGVDLSFHVYRDLGLLEKGLDEEDMAMVEEGMKDHFKEFRGPEDFEVYYEPHMARGL